MGVFTTEEVYRFQAENPAPPARHVEVGSLEHFKRAALASGLKAYPWPPGTAEMSRPPQLCGMPVYEVPDLAEDEMRLVHGDGPGPGDGLGYTDAPGYTDALGPSAPPALSPETGEFA